jgi:large subunit ribosomal protein L32e
MIKMNEKVLEIKKLQKKKLPDFVRGGAYNKARLDKIWRKPRGTSSKKRERLHGNVVVDAGYGTIRELRGKHSSGLEMVNVSSLEEIKNINPKKQGVIVSGKIGLKRRIVILTELIKHKIKVLNISNPEEFLKSKQEKRGIKKQVKEENAKEKKTEKKEKAKEESIEDKISDEEKKKQEKKEIDRLLTKKF